MTAVDAVDGSSTGIAMCHVCGVTYGNSNYVGCMRYDRCSPR